MASCAWHLPASHIGVVAGLGAPRTNATPDTGETAGQYVVICTFGASRVSPVRVSLAHVPPDSCSMCGNIASGRMCRTSRPTTATETRGRGAFS